MSTTEAKPESKSESAKDYFDVLFVGLFCFKKQDRLAVMPDGTQPDDPTVPPHVPFFVVDPKGVDASKTIGWPTSTLTDEGIYRFAKCTIDITKATTPGVLHSSQHDDDDNGLNLVDADKTYQFAGAGAKTIAEIRLGQGTLEMLRRPDAESVARDSGTVSRLRVPHDGEIIVTVAVEGESKPRILALKPGTDIAIANSLLELDPSKKGNPFTLFGRIAKTGKVDPPSSVPRSKLPVISGNYQVFKIKRPVGDGGGGGGVKCCPP